VILLILKLIISFPEVNMEKVIGFIGAGKMGTAILKGVVKSGIIKKDNICIYDIDKSKSEQLAKETGVAVLNGNDEVIRKADLIILAVVPGIIKQVLEPVKSLFNNNKILVSIAAGVPISTYMQILGNNAKVVRAMPNRAALVSQSMTLISYKDELFNDEDISFVKSLFETIGRVEVLDEKLMDAVVALTSSSPAYVFMMIEAMADAAVLHGIPRKSAYTMAAQAVLGSAKMLLETGMHPAQLKDEICTPGGTTIEAVKSLEKNGFRYAIMEAMDKCTQRAQEIGRKLNS